MSVRMMKTTVAFALLACTVIALVPGCDVLFCTGTGTVSGIVKWPGRGEGRSSGLPLVPATQTRISMFRDGTLVRELSPDKEGVFVAGSIVPGSYTMRFEHDDCDPVERTVRIERDRETVVKSEPFACVLLAPEPETKGWTILYYMNATDPAHGKVDLSTLRLIEKVMPGERINVVAWLFDGSSASTRMYSLQKPRFAIDPDPVDDIIETARVLSPFYDFSSDDREIDPGMPATLASFLEFGRSRYPADNFMLVISGHGTGIDVTYPGAEAPASRSISPNVHTNREILVPELARVIGEANPDGKLRIFATEACYMGMVEVAHELSGSGLEYFIASECTVGNRVLDQSTMIAMGDGSADTPLSVAKRMVDGYPGNTLVAVRMAALPGLVSALGTFAEAIDSHGADAPVRAAAAASFGVSFHGGTESDLFSSYHDLGDFAKLVHDSPGLADPALKSAAGALRDAFAVGEGSAIAAFRRNRVETAGARGLSTLLYLPDRNPPRYADYAMPIYRSLKLYREGMRAWDSFLRKLAP